MDPQRTIHFRDSEYYGRIIRKLHTNELQELVCGSQEAEFKKQNQYDYTLCTILYGWRLTGLPRYTPIPASPVSYDIVARVSELECLVRVPLCTPDIFSPHTGKNLKKVSNKFLKSVMDVHPDDRDASCVSFYNDCTHLYGYRLANVAKREVPDRGNKRKKKQHPRKKKMTKTKQKTQSKISTQKQPTTSHLTIKTPSTNRQNPLYKTSTPSCMI